jgi:glyoxylase-like metal-dependent hydrolase (beta-lactamase superfamily II)
MIQVFTFNDFLENTIVVAGKQGSCLIVDPGCYYDNEKQILKNFIREKELKPLTVVNTHGHLDHILGNAFACAEFKIPLYAHRADALFIENMEITAQAYGFRAERSPLPEKWLEEGDVVELDDMKLDILFTPGHSPGSISLFNRMERWIISGDVLFEQSIGRTDLPGGDYQVLMQTIEEKFLTLPSETIVYCGHGPSTTIGAEIQSNPFILEYRQESNA